MNAMTGSRRGLWVSVLCLTIAVATQSAPAQEKGIAKKVSISITSPATGSAIPTPASVVVAYASTGSQKAPSKIDAIELLVNGQVVSTFEVPRHPGTGTHTFSNVDLSSFAGSGVPVSLVARAVLDKKHFEDSVPVLVTVVGGADTTAPRITRVTSTNPNGAYRVGSSIGIVIDFSEPVTLVGGNLRVTLDTGAVVSISPFGAAASASGTYAVAAGQNSPDLNAISPLALEAGGTLRDAAGNDAILTIPTGFNLANLKDLLIDTTAPIVTSPQPPDGSSTTNATPTLSASWSDPSPSSGINTASAVIKVDNQTVNATVTAADFSFTPPAFSPGTHTVSAQISDGAGNTSLLTWSFTVTVGPTDTVPPVISNLLPANGTLTNNPRPLLSASISDAGGSGINGGSVVLVLNSIVVPAAVTFQNPNSASVSFTPSVNLAEGTNTFSVSASDNAGNPALAASSTFTVDVTPPIAAITSPSADTFQNPIISVSATATDGGTGLPLAQVHILLNGVDVTSQLTLAAGPINAFGFPGSVGISGSLTAVPQGNSLAVLVTDAAGNTTQATRNFIIGNPSEPELQLAIAIVSGNGQSGLVCRAASDPLVVRVTNSATGAPVEGVQVGFDPEENAGSFSLGNPDDIITDGGGLARVRYVYSSKPGSNRIRASVATPVTFVDFVLTGQLPTIENKTVVSLCNPTGGSTSEFRGSALPVLFTAKAVHPDGSPLKGEMIRPFVLVNGVPNASVGRFMPTKAWSDAGGEAKFVFIVDLNAPIGTFTMRFGLPQFRNPNNEEVKFDVTGTVRPDADKPRGFLDTEINFNDPLASGQGQIGVPDRELFLPLRARLYGVRSGRLRYTVIEGAGTFTEGTEGTFDQYHTFNPCLPGNIPLSIQTIEESSTQSIGNVKFTLAPGSTHALIALDTLTDVFAVGPPELSIVTQNSSGEYVEIPGIHTSKLADATATEAFQVRAEVPKGATPTVDLNAFDSLGNPVSTIPRAVAASTLSSQALGMQLSGAASSPTKDTWVSSARIVATNDLLPLEGTPTGGGNGTFVPISTTVYGGVQGNFSVAGAVPTSLKVEQVQVQGGEQFEAGRRPLIFYKTFPGAANPNKIAFSFELARPEILTKVSWNLGGDDGPADKVLNGNGANKIFVEYVDGASANGAGTEQAPVQRQIDETKVGNHRKNILVIATIDYTDATGKAVVGLKREFLLRIALNATRAPGAGAAPAATQAGLLGRRNWTVAAGQLTRSDGSKIIPGDWEAGALTQEMANSLAKTVHETRGNALTLADLAANRPTFTKSDKNFTLIKTQVAAGTGVYGSIIGTGPFGYDVDVVDAVIDHEAQHVLFMANAQANLDEPNLPAGQKKLFREFLMDLNATLVPDSQPVIRQIAAFHESVLYFDALNNPKLSYRFLNDSSPRKAGIGTGFEAHAVQYWNAIFRSCVKTQEYTRTMEGEPWGNTFTPHRTINGAVKAALNTFLRKKYDQYLQEFPELEPYREYRLPSASRLTPG